MARDLARSVQTAPAEVLVDGDVAFCCSCTAAEAADTGWSSHGCRRQATRRYWPGSLESPSWQRPLTCSHNPAPLIASLSWRSGALHRHM